MLEPWVEDAVLCPAAHAHGNGVPLAQAIWQASSWASILRPRQKGVEPLPVRNLHIPSLRWSMRCDPLILFFGELHKFQTKSCQSPLVRFNQRVLFFVIFPTTENNEQRKRSERQSLVGLWSTELSNRTLRPSFPLPRISSSSFLNYYLCYPIEIQSVQTVRQRA